MTAQYTKKVLVRDIANYFSLEQITGDKLVTVYESKGKDLEKEELFEISITKNWLKIAWNLCMIEHWTTDKWACFQKTFKTKKLGISLEKQYSTENSLSYGIIFDEDTDVSRVRVSIYDNNGSNEDIESNEYIVEKGNINPKNVSRV